MRNPAGVECAYFFGDYHRGKNREECRLLDTAHPRLTWNPKLCSRCPVPGILRANSCHNLQLKPVLTRPFPFFSHQVSVQAHCKKTNQVVDQPQVGCGECHQLPEVFLQD